MKKISTENLYLCCLSRSEYNATVEREENRIFYQYNGNYRYVLAHRMENSLDCFVDAFNGNIYTSKKLVYPEGDYFVLNFDAIITLRDYLKYEEALKIVEAKNPTYLEERFKPKTLCKRKKTIVI